MTNSYYNPSGSPGTRSDGTSITMRSEFTSIGSAFDKLPALSGNASKLVVVNPGETGLTVLSGSILLAGNFTTTGAFNTTLAQTATVTLTLPAVSGTLATLAGTETLSNKTLVSPALGTPSSGVLTNCTGTAAGLTAGTATNQSGGSVAATTITASGTATFSDILTVGKTGNNVPSVDITGGGIRFRTTMTAPSIIATGFWIYVDVADGVLKARSPGGTVTTLAAA